MLSSKQIQQAYLDRIKWRCENDLIFFARWVFKEIYNKKFVVNLHHEMIADALRKVESGEHPNLAINIAPRHTKAIKCSEPMMTRRGWVKAGDIRIEDYLVGSDGNWTKVVGIAPQGVKKKYTVSFSDGSSIDCCGDHLWSVGVRAKPNKPIKYITKSTKELNGNLYCGDGRKKWQIPMMKPFVGFDNKLPIDPYLFGCWLGDGSSYKAEFCTQDEEIYQAFASEYEVTKRTHQNAGKATEYGIRGGFITKLKELGVVGSKHIPSVYAQASAHERLALLQGMCDTDGCASKDGTQNFANSNEVLIDQFIELVHSLGGTASKLRNNANGNFLGWTVTFRLPQGMSAFRLEKKQSRVSANWNYCRPRRFIESIVESGEDDMICFAVEAKDRLYCAGKQMIVTHNTELVVKLWQAQTFARNHQAQFIHTSYSDDLALDNSSTVREIIQSEPFQRFWPIKIDNSTSAKKLWRIVNGGGVRSCASGSGITGFGAGVMGYKHGDLFSGAIIIDDPLKPDHGYSKVERDKVNNRLTNTIKSRRNSPHVPIVIIMQRLHENDPTGFVLSGAMGIPFAHLKIKTLQDDGTALWPLMITAPELVAMRESDRYTFASQYQQEPTPADGGLIKLDWFGRYNIPPANKKRIIQSWDTASKGAEHNDPSVCTTWLETEHAYYLLDVYRERVEYPALKRAVYNLHEKWQSDTILIEDKASGQAIIQDIRNESKLPIVAINPIQDKVTRLMQVSAIIESGQCMLPERAHWLVDFEHELGIFPNGTHDDQVDSVSQLLSYVQRQKTAVLPRSRVL